MSDTPVGDMPALTPDQIAVLNLDRRREQLLARAGSRIWAADAVSDILTAPEGDERLALGELARRLDERAGL